MTAPNTRLASGPEAMITIFPPVPGMGCGGSSCSCGTSAAPATSAENQLAEFLNQLHGLQKQSGNRSDSQFQIEIMQYGSPPSIRSAIQRLNEVFAASGVEYFVTGDNLGGILAYYAPIIAINNRIISTSAFPDAGQLVEQLSVAVP